MFLDFKQREASLIKGSSNIDFDKFQFFTYSRDAIYKIAKEIGLEKNDEVLIPDYICNTIIDTLYDITKNIKMYAINEKLKFESDDIKLLVNSKTKMILFVDYFGVEVDIKEELVEFLQKNKVIILKDSAHSFLTLIKNNFNSAYKYDYLVSSIYKNLPLYVGAIAIGEFENNNNFINADIIKKRKIITFIKKILCFFGVSRINKGIENLVITNDSYKTYDGKNSYENYKTKLENIDYGKIISNRDRLAIDFFNYFKNKSLFNLDEINKSSLQAFPIWCSSKENRDNILNIMRKECIDAFTWASFHDIAVNEYLWSHILLLPLDEKVLNIAKEQIKDV